MSIGVQASGGTLVTQSLLPTGSDRYFALFSDALAEQECAAAGYSRVAYTGWTQSMDGLSRSNTGPIVWPAFVGAEAVHIAAVGIFDAAVGGNLLFTALTVSGEMGIDAAMGDFIRIPAGNFTLTAA